MHFITIGRDQSETRLFWPHNVLAKKNTLIVFLNIGTTDDTIPARVYWVARLGVKVSITKFPPKGGLCHQKEHEITMISQLKSIFENQN